MKSNFIKKLITMGLIVSSICSLSLISASAEELTPQNSTPTYIQTSHKLSGWQEKDGKRYFYNADGEKVTSMWVKISEKWYYFDKDGVMQSNTWFKDTDGRWYYFYADGSMASNTSIGGYKVGSDGVWIGSTQNNYSYNNSNNTYNNNYSNTGIINNGGVNTNVINNYNNYGVINTTNNVANTDSANTDNSNDKTETNSSIKDSYDLEDFLNENYSSLKTPIGTLSFDFTVDENDNKMFPYDFWIQTDWGDIEDSKYDIDYFSPYDLENSIKISDEDKEKTKELLKEYQEKVAEVAMKYFPKKKIQGGFYSSGYKYEHLRTGFYSIEFLSWTNYNSDAEDYDSSEVNSFEWNSKHDDYDFN